MDTGSVATDIVLMKGATRYLNNEIIETIKSHRKWPLKKSENPNLRLAYEVSVRFPEGAIVEEMAFGLNMAPPDLGDLTTQSVSEIYAINKKRMAFQKYITNEYKNSKLAHETLIMVGKVSVNFNISSTGIMSDITVVSSDDERLTKFIKKAIKNYDKWPNPKPMYNMPRMDAYTISVNFPSTIVENTCKSLFE